MTSDQERRLVKAVESIAKTNESIAKSLRTLAESTKANRVLKEKLLADFASLDNAIYDLKEDPFGFKQME